MPQAGKHAGDCWGAYALREGISGGCGRLACLTEGRIPRPRAPPHPSSLGGVEFVGTDKEVVSGVLGNSIGHTQSYPDRGAARKRA